jgi:hypothetical protein
MSINVNQEKLADSLRYLDKLGANNVEQLKISDPELAERFEKLGELFYNAEFCKALESCKDYESAAKLFADKGFEITMEEMKALNNQMKYLYEKLISNDGELGEDDLEMVAGGKLGWILACLASAAGLGASIGSAIIPGIGTAVGACVGLVVGGIIVTES